MFKLSPHVLLMLGALGLAVGFIAQTISIDPNSTAWLAPSVSFLALSGVSCYWHLNHVPEKKWDGFDWFSFFGGVLSIISIWALYLQGAV